MRELDVGFGRFALKQPLITALWMVFSACTSAYLGPQITAAQVSSVPPDTFRNPIPIDDVAGSFSVPYQNWITVDRDLTISVDSAFARLKSGDNDMHSILREFLRPAYDMMTTNYGIDLPAADPEPDYKLKRFVVNTEFSPWKNGNLSPESPLLSLSRNHTPPEHIRWRARVGDSAVSFNSMTPRRVVVRVQLEVNMQVYSPEAKEWQNSQFSRRSVQTVANDLRSDLTKAYRAYLLNRFGVKVTSSGPIP